MEASPKAVADVLAHDRESILVGFCNHVFSDDTYRTAWGKCPDRSMHGVKCALRDGAGFFGDIADEKSLGLISMPSLDDRRDVDVDDVSIFENIIPWDPMANHIVDARATAFGITQIPKSRRSMLVRKGVLVDEPIDFTGAYAGLDVATDVVHELGVEATCCPHSLALGL